MKIGTLLFMLAAVPVYAQLCAPASTLLPNDSQSASIDSNSCTLGDGTSYIPYFLTVPARGTLVTSLKGVAGFTPAFILRDTERHLIASGASINRYVEAGTYLLLVNTSQPNQLGKFTLTSVFTPEASTLCKYFPMLGAGQAVTRQLAAQSCKLPDQSSFDGYRITVFGAGMLTITMTSADFDSYVILRGDNGSAMAYSQSGGKGKVATISLPVDGNTTYTIIAAAASSAEKTGHYSLSTSFSPNTQETCVSQGALTDSVPWTGSMGTASCDFNLSGRQDSSLFNFYNLHVSSSGIAKIAVSGSSFSPLLLLLDANGNEIAEDALGGGNAAPLLIQQLAAGDYQVLIFNEESYEGSYTIQYSLTQSGNQACPTITLTGTASANGVLDGQSNCRVSTFLADTYQIQLPSSGTLNVDLSSGDFTSLLFLQDAKGNQLYFGEETTDNGSAHIQIALPAGTYYAVAASADLPGAYTFHYAIAAAPLPACPSARGMALNSNFAGHLGGKASCMGNNAALVDNYSFTTTAPGVVAFSMTSADLNSRLSLSDSKGNLLRMDGDSYSQGNAIIVQFLQTGSYKIVAGSDGFVNTGDYQVRLQFAGASSPPQTCAAKAISLNTPLKGSLSFTSCQYYDNTFADLYQVKVTNGSTPLDISLITAQFDAYLILLDSKGNLITVDDSGGGANNAHVLQNITPGTYFIVVKPASDPTSSGSYSLTAK